MYVLVCRLGAFLVGAHDRADEFFAMAREHAGMLFDRGTYANAEALYCMAYLAFCRVRRP